MASLPKRILHSKSQPPTLSNFKSCSMKRLSYRLRPNSLLISISCGGGDGGLMSISVFILTKTKLTNFQTLIRLPSGKFWLENVLLVLVLVAVVKQSQLVSLKT